ncbi:MAG: M14 family metallocarboxypeptidase [Oscillospiraceae bacterium]|nr:M14 family metallocarboxypeptidase [Oscillospiraceae bacterium]
MKKRLLAFLLVLCMCCALFPAAAFASEEPAASSEAAASEEVQALSASLVFTYPEGIEEDEVTIELYAGFPTSSSKTLDVMIEDGELTLIPEEDGYTVTEAGTYSYHISGDGYYNILKIFNITEEDIASGEIVIEVTGGKVSETDGYQPTVVPENAPDTYSMDSRDAMLCIWPDEILENFTVEDQGYETPAFDGTDAAHEFTTQEELEEFLADRDESCDYMYLYSAGTTPNYEMDIPLVIFTETEIPEDATLEEAAELVTANGKPTVWYQAQIHPNEPAAGEGALVIIDDFVNDEETAALLENVNVIVVPRINPDGSYLFTRVTYDGFDMNRDHMALKAEELAQLHTAYRLFMAEVVIDGHEFTFYGANADGYMRQADDVETTPATSLNDDEEVTALGLEMAAYAFETAEDAGLRIYHYGTTTNNPIGRAYFGLYNCLSFLVETRGIGAGKTNFERRVYSQETVVMSYITYTAEHADEIVETVAAAREETIEMGKTYDEDELLALYQTASGDTLTDYEGTRVQYNMDGTVYSEETNALELQDTIVRSRTRPTAYVLPADLENIEEILYVIDNQGIEYYTLDPGTTVTLQQYYYVGPYMIDEETERGIEADLYEATEVTFENGAYVFPMDQVGANILAMLMEPDVTDSVGYDGTLYQYGLIDYDEETGDFPIYRYTGDNPRETLVSNAGETASEEASDEASEEAADTLSVEDAYVEYIHEWLLAELEVNSSLTEDQVENEFMPLIEAGDYVSFPAEMLYGGMLESGTAMTFEEFAAQY